MADQVNLPLTPEEVRAARAAFATQLAHLDHQLSWGGLTVNYDSTAGEALQRQRAITAGLLTAIEHWL